MQDINAVSSVSKETMKVVVFHFRQLGFWAPHLPLMLRLSCLLKVPDQSEAQQGLLSPLIPPSPSPWQWFRQIVDTDSGTLVNPFMRVANWMRHSTTVVFIAGALPFSYRRATTAFIPREIQQFSYGASYDRFHTEPPASLCSALLLLLLIVRS